MQGKPFTCRKFFTSMFFISAFTFGGGFVIIPLMRKKFVEELGWLEENDMLDLIAIAQSSPGAVSLNVASQLGYRCDGVRGMLFGILGTLIPPFVWICAIASCYDAFRTSPIVDAFLRSMQPAVAAVILSAAVSMLKTVRQRRKVSGWLLFAGGLALAFAGVNVIWLLLFGAAFGSLTAVWEVKRHAA